MREARWGDEVGGCWKREVDGKRGKEEPERRGEERVRELEEIPRSRLFGGEWMLASLDGPPTVPDLISP